MFPLDPAKVLANARRAETEDLLDRVTVFREVMEPSAVEIIEAELARRGVTPDDIAQHHRRLKPRVVRDSQGIPLRCCRCGRAAVVALSDWHLLLGLVPLFRRRFAYCDRHRPDQVALPD